MSYIINVADKGYYDWHPECVRFWLNINYDGELQGQTRHHRLCNAGWLALTGLMVGGCVLIPCRQGKHRSGCFAMLLMMILAPEHAMDYESVEGTYFSRNSRVQRSEWHEWWYDERGRQRMPDRWRIWNTWTSLDLSLYVQYFRNKLWVHAICSQMHCLPARFDAFSQHPASSVQLRSGSRSP